MKKLFGATIALALLTIFISSAQAINVTSATVVAGFAVVEGNQAAKGALVVWEGSGLTTTTKGTKGGTFKFSLGAVPSDCTGRLTIGPNTIDVLLSSCTPTPTGGVLKTGQTKSYASGDDGALQKGLASPNPRFTDNSNGTITDNLTGLIWLQNGNCFGLQIWTAALSVANGLADGACGLSDNSVAGDWRLPNVNELTSLLDLGEFDPVLPSGHPFTDFQSAQPYWSSTTWLDASDTGTAAWTVGFSGGGVLIGSKASSIFFIAVRGGS